MQKAGVCKVDSTNADWRSACCKYHVSTSHFQQQKRGVVAFLTCISHDTVEDNWQNNSRCSKVRHVIYFSYEETVLDNAVPPQTSQWCFMCLTPAWCVTFPSFLHGHCNAASPCSTMWHLTNKTAIIYCKTGIGKSCHIPYFLQTWPLPLPFVSMDKEATEKMLGWICRHLKTHHRDTPSEQRWLQHWNDHLPHWWQKCMWSRGHVKFNSTV